MALVRDKERPESVVKLETTWHQLHTYLFVILVRTNDLNPVFHQKDLHPVQEKRDHFKTYGHLFKGTHIYVVVLFFIPGLWRVEEGTVGVLNSKCLGLFPLWDFGILVSLKCFSSTLFCFLLMLSDIWWFWVEAHNRGDWKWVTGDLIKPCCYSLYEGRGLLSPVLLELR